MRRHRACRLWTLVALVLGLLFPMIAHAKLEFEREAVDFSLAQFEPEIIARYPFRNGGASPVTITAIRSDCSCTTPTLAKNTYAAGEAGEVVVRFQVGLRHGIQRKAVIVSTNDPAQPQVVLALSATMPKAMTLSSELLLWKEGEALNGKTLVVKTFDTPPVEELRVHAGTKLLQVAVERVNLSEFRVTVTPSATARNVSDALQLEAVWSGGVLKRSSAFVRVR